MSDPTPPDEPGPPGGSGPEDRDELLAAEYVLGTLPGDTRRAVRARVAVDAAFAARVTAWEGRLAPLNEGYREAPAPDLLPRIEARLFGAATPDAAPLRRGSWRGWTLPGWRGGALGAAAAALVVALVLAVWPPAPAPVVLQAELVAEETELRFDARWDAAAGQLELRRVAGDAAPAGQVHELWLIDEDGVPRSLGLLRDPLTQLTTVLGPGQTLAVSLEPEGGSPDPVPSGPVLAAAPLTDG